MCAKSNLSRVRSLVALLMMAAACGLLARADDTSVPAARVTSPELEKMLQSSERLRDAVNAQVKLLEEQYVKQRKLSTDVSLDPDARAGATKEAANANPTIPFSIVDYAYAEGDITANNVLGQVFNTDEAAYLAGYLAAGMSKTGKIGTFGGINIPPVTIFMDGFYRGAMAYNAANGAKVEVLGWDPAKQKGLFTENFESLDDGRSFAQNLVDEGADVVMPVAGPVGLGSAALAKELGPDKLLIIGVDSDQFESDTANQSVYLTSVLKNMDVTTFNAIASVLDGTFAGGVTVGTLANGGVGLAPFHDLDASVPQALKDQIETLKAGISDGSVDVKK